MIVKAGHSELRDRGRVGCSARYLENAPRTSPGGATTRKRVLRSHSWHRVPS